MNAKDLARWAVPLGCLVAAVAAPARAGAFSAISVSETLTAVSAKSFNGYVRARLAGGTFRPETYAFGNGGMVGSQLYAVRDPTIDDIGFDSIARTIAVPLRDQNYLPASDPNTAGLLIMVFWGRTTGSYASRDGATQDLLTYWNAELLGFDTGEFSELTFEPALPGYGTNFRAHLLRDSRLEAVDEIKVSRYFVILRAYDFQSLWRSKKVQPLWETRFSLSERRHDFREELPAMARYASLYFGQDSHGLVRIPPVPAGRIDIGDLRTLGAVPGN